MRQTVLRCAVVMMAAAMSPPASAREQIHIVGSGTVYPFATMAAEQFGQSGGFKTPIVEATGTGGGFKLFCAGVGLDTPDINDASRAITDSEKESCEKNGVTGFVEIAIGYDAIVFANKKGASGVNLTKKQIFMALARELPDKNGKLVKNPNQTWKDIDPKLPGAPIEVYGPGIVSGTRDSFAETVLEKGCAQFPEFAKLYPDEKLRSKICRMMREDGKYIESGENYNVTVQKLTADSQAFGIMGYGFYRENAAKIQAALIDGVAPDSASIESGKYGIARKLYVYVKIQHVGTVPGIPEFIKELTGDNAIGPDGYLTAKGLLPLSGTDRKAAHAGAGKLAGK